MAVHMLRGRLWAKILLVIFQARLQAMIKAFFTWQASCGESCFPHTRPGAEWMHYKFWSELQSDSATWPQKWPSSYGYLYSYLMCLMETALSRASPIFSCFLLQTLTLTFLIPKSINQQGPFIWEFIHSHSHPSLPPTTSVLIHLTLFCASMGKSGTLRGLASCLYLHSKGIKTWLLLLVWLVIVIYLDTWKLLIHAKEWVGP